MLLLACTGTDGAAPGSSGPGFTGELSEPLGRGTGPAGTAPAATQPTVPHPQTGTAAAAATVPPLAPHPGPSAPAADPAAAEAQARDCPPLLAAGFRLADTSPAAASIEVSKAAFRCAHEVGLAFADNAAAISALASRDIDGPLLLADSGLSVELLEELRRLAPQTLVVAGIDEQIARLALADAEFEHLDVEHWDAEHGGGGSPQDRLWIVDDSGEAAALAGVARQVGAGVVASPGDLRALPRPAREAVSAASEVVLLADAGEDADWQLEVLRRGEELPGGGLLLFGPGNGGPDRRLVAAYGHPSSGALGVLGEQGPEEAVERLQAIAEGYAADGATILPTFEIIATVASASAGADGDYSRVTDLETIRPWIEEAAANDVYVVLDLQPGRSDYLSQAKIYEEFLRLPHVGLALDPEWRLKPNQVHLRQIGAVDAAEVNQVVDWLAGIVREEALPQKLLIVHQFRLSMITNRALIDTPSELAVLVHMDGQGSLAAKYGTWSTLTGEAGADRFHWGWKNFYDEDSPVATPEQVLELSPDIVFVSFQ